MKTKILLISLLSLLNFVDSHAQNVGINTPNPQEALDVTGNMRLSGALKVNGNNAGQPGQALVSTGGGLAWVDLAANQFTNFRNYYGPVTNFNWVRPVNVTKIMIEAWGGGGGGSAAGGGGGGAYAVAVIDVTSITQISLTIGGGGAGGGNSGTSVNGVAGGTTTISWTDGAITRQFNAPGGGFGTNLESGAGGGVNPATFTSNVSASTSLMQLPGLPGEPYFSSFNESAAGVFRILVKGGRGGGVHRFENNGGIGHNYASNGGTSIPILSSSGRASIAPGGGGGSGLPATNNGDNNGGAGMVIIRW